MSVNVHTEWGRLREVILGSVMNYSRIADITFRLVYANNLKYSKLEEDVITTSKQYIEERQEDLENLQKLFESLNIKVHRPDEVKMADFKSPNWKGITRPVDNPRDQVLVVGDHIIETPCMQRNRYFENDLMKKIFMDYYRKGARWSSAPRPMLLDKSFDYSYLKREKAMFPDIDIRAVENTPEDYEIIFDAAQCLKFGKDIVMNVSTQNHVLGAEWLQRHLGEQYRIHQVRLTDNHIDGMIMPLRPGVLLINPMNMHDKKHLLPKPLQGWDTLVMPEEEKGNYPVGEVLLASSSISVNVLPIDEKRIIVYEDMPKLIKTLERKGFTPIPIKFRHARIFGGGIHCATLDTIRDGKLEDYF